MTFRSHTVIVALLTLLFVIAIDSKVHGAAAPSEAEWAKTIAAAKKEGMVSVFLYHRENIETAIRVFEKAFPDIQLVIASTAAAETGPRLMAERRAGKFLWDVCICGPTTPLGVLYPAKAQRRVAGTKYIVMDTPERSNQEPVNKLFKEIIKK